jgi:hypothetical protein
MARIRTIKPDLLRHEGLFEAERSSGLPIRIAWVGLFTVADREGRFRWRPLQLKLDVLPYDAVNFDDVLEVLRSCGFIERYEADGMSYGYIPSWKKHQVINVREAKSVLPEPFPSSANTCTSAHVQAAADTKAHVHTRGEKEMEGKGREREKEVEGEWNGREAENEGERERNCQNPPPDPCKNPSCNCAEMNPSECAGKLMNELLISGLQNRVICDEAIARCAKHRDYSVIEATEFMLSQARVYQQSEQYASYWRKPWVKWLSGGHWNETPERWKERRNDPDPISPSPTGRSIKERIRRQRAGLDPDGPEPTPPELMGS